jgi:hypothetical protein
MIKYFTKRDIMELICISAATFEWHIKKLNIVPLIIGERLYFYSIQNMIQLYYSVYSQNTLATIESKMNYKKMKL